MNTEKRAQLKVKIEEAIAEATEKIERREETTTPAGPDTSVGRLGRMGATANRGIAEAALNQAKRKLAALKLAYGKIDDPDFGKCTLCGNEIQEGRLMFMPGSPYCINCAK